MTKSEIKEFAICASLVLAFVLVVFAPQIGLFVRFGVTEVTMWHLTESFKIIGAFALPLFALRLTIKVLEKRI